MAGRPGSTFGKRQREQKLIERRQEKSARKEQRKVDKQNGILDDGDEIAAATGSDVPESVIDDLHGDEETEKHPPAVPTT